MTKFMYVTLGALVLLGAGLMITAAPDKAGGSPSVAQGGMDIRSLERSMNLNALPKNELDPAAFQ